MTSPADLLRDTPLLSSGLRFEEVVFGSAFKTASRTVYESDMTSFIQLVGINEPLFLDASHAASAGYSGQLVPGSLVFCYAEGLVLQTNVLHGTGMAFMHMDLDITAPTYVGDTLTVVVEVTDTRKAKKGERGIVTTRNTVFNQRGEVVQVYTPVRMIKGASAGQG